MGKYWDLKMDTKKTVKIFLQENLETKKADVVKSLNFAGYKKSSIYKYLKYQEGSIETKNNIDVLSEAAKIKNENLKKLKKLVINKEYKSYHFLGEKINLHHNTVKKYLKELKITKNIRQIVPKVSTAE